jgi:hypothetical protein
MTLTHGHISKVKFAARGILAPFRDKHLVLSLAYFLHALAMELHIWHNCSLHERMMFLDLDPGSAVEGIFVPFKGKCLVLNKNKIC